VAVGGAGGGLVDAAASFRVGALQLGLSVLQEVLLGVVMLWCL